MATPDPHMSEMLIMAYEPKHRTCKTAHPVPRRSEYIDVLWCMDHLPNLPEKWCAAEVLHVSDTPEQDYLATGVILYLPSDTWDEQTHRVEFLDNRKLRRAAEIDRDNDEEQDEDNPVLEWRYSSKREDKVSIRDTAWVPKKDRNRNHLSRADCGDTVSLSSSDDLAALRKNHATTSVEIQKLKRAVTSLSSQLCQLQGFSTTNQMCTGASCVLPRLRHKLFLKAQNNPRPMQLSGKKRTHDDSEQVLTVRTGDGLHVGVMKAKVECSIRQFEDLACHIQANNTPSTVVFFPHFQHTQQPLQCSDEFRIIFSRFADLADHIGISSKSDRLEMVRKCGSGPQGELLRLLGTYKYDKTDEKMAAEIFLGVSCGDPQEPEKGAPHDVGVEKQAAHLHPVLFRKSREWNAVDKRFVHGLNLQHSSRPILGENCSELHAFQLQWRRAPDVSTRLWSQMTAESPHIHGCLEVMLPFVQTQGRYLCVEVGGKACDDVWKGIL